MLIVVSWLLRAFLAPTFFYEGVTSLLEKPHQVRLMRELKLDRLFLYPVGACEVFVAVAVLVRPRFGGLLLQLPMGAAMYAHLLRDRGREWRVVVAVLLSLSGAALSWVHAHSTHDLATGALLLVLGVFGAGATTVVAPALVWNSGRMRNGYVKESRRRKFE